MTSISPNRLLGVRQLVDWWKDAVRDLRAGRGPRSTARWRRLARALGALGGTAPEPLLRRLGSVTATAFGPPSTPTLTRPPSRTLMGLTLTTTSGSVRMSRRQIEGVQRTGAFDMVVDLPRAVCLVRGRTVPLEGRGVPLNILAALVRARGQPLELRELFQQGWGRPFEPDRISTVHFHVSWLRSVFEQVAPGVPVISCRQSAYRLSPGLRCALVENPTARRRPSRDPGQILSLLMDCTHIDNRTYCELTGLARSAALRALSRLVDSGVLVRQGAGRSVRYRLAGRTGSPAGC
ncbi:MAG: hypothetical protein HY815_25400 [Candidatus Riflebacteria bacterium]|nr:hypothetical protein [Candidatus Riflebacteria bacterium]